MKIFHPKVGKSRRNAGAQRRRGEPTSDGPIPLSCAVTRCDYAVPHMTRGPLAARHIKTTPAYGLLSFCLYLFCNKFSAGFLQQNGTPPSCTTAFPPLIPSQHLTQTSDTPTPPTSRIPQFQLRHLLHCPIPSRQK